MPDFTGFEPHVGEIRALRTFRIGPQGRLYPLFSDRAWSDVQNTAQCAISAATGETTPHSPPEQDCTCGFYGYGSETAALDYPHSRHVLAVVTCWGKMITGTRGIRAEQACLEAIWMSSAVPTELAGEVTTRYPSAKTYRSTEQMLIQHPITVMESYEIERAPLPYRRRFGAMPAIGTGRHWLLIIAASIWLVAPAAGPLGWLLIRCPMVEIAAMIALQRYFDLKESRRFPAQIGQGRSPIDRGKARRQRRHRCRSLPKENR